MSTLETILLMLLVVDAITLAVLVLLQQGKGADVGAAFGSGGASTMFGSAGSASFFTKLTVWLAIGFFLISFGLAYTAKQRAASLDSLGIPLLDSANDGSAGAAAPAETSKPAEPAEPAAGAAVEAAGAAATDASGDADAQEQLTKKPDSVDSDIPVL